MPRILKYVVTICDICAGHFGVTSAWLEEGRTTLEETCEVCGFGGATREVSSNISGPDLRAALPAIKRNSDDARKKREQEVRDRADKELACRALELAQKLAKQNTPAQLKAKLADANRVMPKRNRVITLE